MNIIFTVTVTGPETSGLLNQLAEITHAHEARWLNSRTIHLEGRMACLLKVTAPTDKADTLQQDFAALPGFHVECHPIGEGHAKRLQTLNINFNSEDRPGLVSAIAQTLEDHDLKLDHIDSRRISVREVGRTLFSADIKLLVPDDFEPEIIISALETLSDHSSVEVNSETGKD